MTKMGKSLSTTVGHYNNSYKELGKIDKDVVRITGGRPLNTAKVNRPTGAGRLTEKFRQRGGISLW